MSVYCFEGVWFLILLYCDVLYCIVLYCIVLYFIAAGRMSVQVVVVRSRCHVRNVSLCLCLLEYLPHSLKEEALIRLD